MLLLPLEQQQTLQRLWPQRELQPLPLLPALLGSALPVESLKRLLAAPLPLHRWSLLPALRLLTRKAVGGAAAVAAAETAIAAIVSRATLVIAAAATVAVVAGADMIAAEAAAVAVGTAMTNVMGIGTAMTAGGVNMTTGMIAIGIVSETAITVTIGIGIEGATASTVTATVTATGTAEATATGIATIEMPMLVSMGTEEAATGVAELLMMMAAAGGSNRLAVAAVLSTEAARESISTPASSCTNLKGGNGSTRIQSSMFRGFSNTSKLALSLAQAQLQLLRVHRIES